MQNAVYKIKDEKLQQSLLDLGVKIKETNNNMGLCLAPFYIRISKVDHSMFNQFWIMHEVGHWLQYKKYGFIVFYLFFGLPSVLSQYLELIDPFKKYKHRYCFAEKSANQFAYNYFKNVIGNEKIALFRLYYPF
ncbi:MAG: hypothetical protein EAZ53_12960 [Bacteroidetes bacterium]|nr:MAG: hypothetical protein EAZ53_12960 [Bacteroidota bacterium]